MPNVSASPASAQSVDTSEPPRGLTGGEKVGLALILAAFLLTGFNLIRSHSWVGQDFGFHYTCTQEMMKSPGVRFWLDYTNRPLLYWIGAAALHWAGPDTGFRVVSWVNLLTCAGALGLVYDSSRYFIRSPWLRIAAAALIALLPLTLMTSIVYAGDTVAILPYALLCWGLVRALHAKTLGRFIVFGGVASLGLTVGQFAKFTFTGMVPAAMIAGALAWYWRWLDAKRFGILLAWIAIVPGGTAYWLHRECSRQLAGTPPRHSYSWEGTGEMTWRTLLWPKSTDRRIFGAPEYFAEETVGERRVLPLLEHNGYSYPALLHLGTFTDVLGTTHRSRMGPIPRPAEKQRFAELSVAAGMAWSVATLLSMVAFTGMILAGLVRRRPFTAPGPWIWGSLGLAWYLPIVAFLPFIHFAYDWGYWLPRLVQPAIWGFLLVLFALADRVLPEGKHRWVRFVAIAILIGSVAQCYLHVRSLWT